MILKLDLKVHIYNSLIEKYVFPMIMHIDHYEDILQLLTNFTMSLAKNIIQYYMKRQKNIRTIK